MAMMCSHPEARDRQVCLHVIADADLSYLVRFTGVGTEYLLTCAACADSPSPPLARVCSECFAVREGQILDAVGVRGRPEVRSRTSNLRFEHHAIRIPGLAGVDLAAVAPLADRDGGPWLALVNGSLTRLDLDPPSLTPIIDLSSQAGIDLAAPVSIDSSPDGRFAAVVNANGRHGVIVDLTAGAITMRLDRGEYHEEHCAFSIGFFVDRGRPVLVHATAWNRLDLSDPRDGTLMTTRGPTEHANSAAAPPEHYLDYFHAGLTVSPDGRWLVDDGWVWHPVGMLRSLDLRRWHHENPWESEDGSSLRNLRSCGYHWDGPRCFADARTLLVWGFGPDADYLVDAAVLYDVETGQRLRWFAGPPRGRFVVDSHLIVTNASGTTVWDLTSGERLLEVAAFIPMGFHPGTRCHLSVATDGSLITSRLVDG